MFTRPKGWLTGAIWKPKNLHSLEHLKFLYGVLCKNQTVTEQNKSLLVETLRSISEILIWGDQNDSSVFDFFLEKNMLAFFLRFMRQKSGRYICVQLLQTLNILFENISNETSVYYLLSNNHINSIIVHKFDFSDEEVMAYYISFLKTLSLKLNKHTIHFFYNEHTNDFALYTEAIKFFNHPESMVRIAVRTITLNVYKACRFCIKTDERGLTTVDDKSMLRYIRDKTAAPYFSNLVWFIGNHIIELDSCVRNDADHNSRDRLADLVAEHLDHLHYLNDILCLKIDALNEVLTDHLLNRLLIPLYVYSLTKRRKFSARTDDRPHVSSVVSLFLLSQVFLIISHSPLVRQLADIIFNGDMNVCMGDTPDTTESPQAGKKGRLRGFVKPSEPLAKTLESNRGPGKPMRRPNFKNAEDAAAAAAAAAGGSGRSVTGGDEETEVEEDGATASQQTDTLNTEEDDDPPQPAAEVASPGQNSTDEEKLLQGGTSDNSQLQAEFSLQNRPYLEAVFSALGCTDNDYGALFALCLLYAMGHNLGINQELLDSVLMPTDASVSKDHYNVMLIEKLIHIIHLSCQNSSKIRLATLEMTILLLRQLVYREMQCYLQDRHLAAVEGAREESTLLLRNFYKVWEKSEEIFLDMFEDEYREMKNRPLNVEYLMMDASILLPPTGTPLTGIDFNKRLPCGEVERARRAIRVFFMLRDLSLTLRQEEEMALPLTKQEECVKVNDVLDLNNSDLIACTVMTRDQQSKRERRFLVIDLLQLILVEPDTRRLGWGVVKFVGFLQDVEVTGDKDDSRSLHITIHKPSMNMHARPLPLLSARFIFDDHIRCMAAKQRLTKGRLKARQRKMQMIARLLELPTHIVDAIYHAPQYPQSATSLRTSQPPAAPLPGRLLRHPGQAQGQRSHGSESRERVSEKGQTRRSSSKRGPSQPISIRSPVGGAVRQIPAGTTSTSSQAHQGSPEIEEAEEATPSPEAHAFQTLNSSYEMTQEAKNGRGSRSSSSDRVPSVQEIPLEDLSRRGKSAKASRRRSEKRSSSASPHRFTDGDIKSPSPQGSPLSTRARDVTTRARVEARRRRAGSLPLTKEDEAKQMESSKPDFTGVTQSEASLAQAEEGASEDPSTVDEADTVDGVIEAVVQDDPVAPVRTITRSRSSSGSGVPPPSLTPALEPTVSLIATLNTDLSPTLTQATDSPKLMPPVETERIRSFSDPTSSSKSDIPVMDACLAPGTEREQDEATASPESPDSVQTSSPSTDTSLSSPSQSDTKPRPPFTISGKCPSSVGENPTAADAERAEDDVNASEQLSKMAQSSTASAPVCADPNDIPLSPRTNVSDEDKAQEQ